MNDARISRAAWYALALVALGAGLSGCAGMSDTISPAFADPAKYDLYDCKQLETERKSLANRSAELQGLMAKAETGVGGAVAWVVSTLSSEALVDELIVHGSPAECRAHVQRYVDNGVTTPAIAILAFRGVDQHQCAVGHSQHALDLESESLI